MTRWPSGLCHWPAEGWPGRDGGARRAIWASVRASGLPPALACSRVLRGGPGGRTLGAGGGLFGHRLSHGGSVISGVCPSHPAPPVASASPHHHVRLSRLAPPAPLAFRVFFFAPTHLVSASQRTSMVNKSVRKSKNGTILFEPFIVYRIHR